jgi:hypothetical protein
MATESVHHPRRRNTDCVFGTGKGDSQVRRGFGLAIGGAETARLKN